MDTISIDPITANDRETVSHLIADEFGSARMVTRGRLVDTAACPGFMAWRGEEPIGVATYEIEGDACEIMVLLSRVEGIGVGSALIDTAREVAEAAGCKRLWLITTNDNSPALRFYQKRGFRLVAVYPNALEQSRRLKPEIPLIGLDGIPLRDEIELEIQL
jgi:GNAT superfamily N-acetyltransferase